MLFITNLSLLIKNTNIAMVDISRQIVNFKLNTFQWKHLLKRLQIFTFFEKRKKTNKFSYSKKIKIQINLNFHEKIK